MVRSGISVFCRQLIFVLCSLSLSVYGQASKTVNALSLFGNHSFSSQQVTSHFSLQPGAGFSESSLKEDLKRIEEFYTQRGYLQVHIDSINIVSDTVLPQVNILVYMNEGDLCRFGSISIEGGKVFGAEELLKGMPALSGSTFSSLAINEEIQRMLRMYEDAGYPLAKIAIQRLTWKDSASSSFADVHLHVEEGGEVYVSEIRVAGNTSTKEFVLVREARLKDRQVFTSEVSEKIKYRLDRLQLFSSVSLPELYLTEAQKGGLLIQIKEGNHNNFDGVLGYMPATAAGGSGYLTGLVNVSLRNLFGTGRKLSFRWYQENASTQETEFHYMEPWIMSYPVNGQFGFFQRKQDSLYVRVQYDAALDLMLSEEFSVGGSFSESSVYPTEGYGKSSIPESRSWNIGLSLRYDSRDDRVTPSRGIFYATEYTTGIKTVSAMQNGPEGSTSTTQRVLFDLSYYLSPFVRQTVALETHARSIGNGRMDVSDMFRLGGASTLRGYKEGQFLGSRIAWITAEYRLLVARRSYFYGFLDGGYISTPQLSATTTGAEQSKVGYGIGVRMDSALGLIGVSLAFGEGDTFSTSKLHFRVINEF